jgi:hypothetical protein
MRFRGSACVIGLVALLASAATVRAFDDVLYPNLVGMWRTAILPTGGGQIPFDPTRQWGKGQQAPLIPEYEAILERSVAEQENGGQGNWLSGARCSPAPMPTVMNMYGEMEFVVLPEITHILLNHNSEVHRRIYTDGRDWPSDVEPSFQGYSIGKWIDSDGDGTFDLLEVETRHFKGPRALDPSGLPTHADNRSVIKERIFFDKGNPALLRNEMTLIDNAFTRPWTVLKAYRRDPSKFPIFPDQECAATSAIMQIGSESYYLSADRELMPTRRDQPPPDLRYFRQGLK